MHKGLSHCSEGAGLFVFAMRSGNITEQDGIDEWVAIVVVDYNPDGRIFLDSGQGG